MTKRKPKPPPDDPEQSRRFIEKARELGADESGRAFKDAIAPGVLGSKPPPQEKPKRKPG